MKIKKKNHFIFTNQNNFSFFINEKNKKESKKIANLLFASIVKHNLCFLNYSEFN